MTESVIDRPSIGVAVMLWKGDYLLLGQRVHTHGEDCWQFPGGHLETGETVTECAARELQEETGLEACALIHAGFSNEMYRTAKQHYLTLFVNAEYISGEPRVVEPDKCRCWQWFHYKQLPSPLFMPITNLLKQVSDLGVLRADPGIRTAVHR